MPTQGCTLGSHQSGEGTSCHRAPTNGKKLSDIYHGHSGDFVCVVVYCTHYITVIHLSLIALCEGFLIMGLLSSYHDRALCHLQRFLITFVLVKVQ